MLEHMIASCLALLLSTDKTEYRAKTVIDFSEVRLTGEVERPAATYVRARGKLKFRPLIHRRSDFRPELQKSLEQL
jgi:hypothetical protein